MIITAKSFMIARHAIRGPADRDRLSTARREQQPSIIVPRETRRGTACLPVSPPKTDDISTHTGNSIACSRSKILTTVNSTSRSLPVVNIFCIYGLLFYKIRGSPLSLDSALHTIVLANPSSLRPPNQETKPNLSAQMQRFRANSPSVYSSSEVSLAESPTPPSSGRSQGSSIRRSLTIENAGCENDHDRFVFPGPLSPVTDRKASSHAISIKLSKPTSSKNAIVESRITAEELRSDTQRAKPNKEKGIARESTRVINEPVDKYLPLLKEDSRHLNQPDNGIKMTKPRSNSFHSKLANLNQRLASADTCEAQDQQMQPRYADSDQKTLRLLRLQSLIHSDLIRDLHTETRALAETLKRLRRTTARDIQSLKDDSERQRENSDQLVRAWEGMRRELLELGVRMAREGFGQKFVGRDGDRVRDGGGGSHETVLPFPPPQSLMRSPPTAPGEHAFSGHPHPYSWPDMRNSNRSQMTDLDTNQIPAMTNAPIRGQRYAPTRDTTTPVAGPNDSQTLPASYGIHQNPAYNPVLPQYQESHILQNPQGCRWRHCPVCWSGGERGVWFE